MIAKSTIKGDIFFIHLFCLALGGIIRIAYCWKYPVPVRDAFEYERVIKQWLTSGIIPDFKVYPPLSMFFVKVPSGLLEYPIMKTGIIVNVVLGLGIIWVLMQIAEMICSTKMAVLFAGLFSATHYILVQNSCQLLRDNSYLFFCCLSILYFIKYCKNRKMSAIIACAIFVSLSSLCRNEAIEMLLLFSGGIVLMRQKNIIKTRLVSLILLFFVSVSCFIVTTKVLGLPNEFYKDYFDKIMKTKKSSVYNSFSDTLFNNAQ